MVKLNTAKASKTKATKNGDSHDNGVDILDAALNVMSGVEDNEYPEVGTRRISIPPLQKAIITLKLVGDRPLLVNNKMNVAEDIANRYSPAGKASHVKAEVATVDDQYRRAFYVMPNSPKAPPHPDAWYGVPASGIKKCSAKGARPAGITDNTTIGLINNSYFVLADGGSLCRLYFEKLERDVRAVNIGSGTKTVPQMRHRPMFHGWYVNVRICYNPKVLSPEMIVNLFMYAGQFIGLHEMRAEKKQGECGGFVVEA